MKTRILGKSGIRVSEVGLGCWQLGGDFGPVDDRQAMDVLGAAETSGIDFWDTADVYGDGLSERRIAQYLDGSRYEPVITTKVGRHPTLYPDGYSKSRVRRNIEGSAKRLGVECIDLVQLHCVPPEVLATGDMIGWMEDFRQQGLLRAFGASVETLDEAKVAAGSPGLTSLQIIFNIFRQDAIDELFPLAQANGVGIIVRLPLASGVLGGTMTRDHKFAQTDHRHYNRHGEAFSVGETFSGIPFETAISFVDRMKPWLPPGMSMAQMAMRWILDQPAVTTVIAGASRTEQVHQNAAASDLPALPANLHEKLSTFYRREVASAITVPL